MLISYRELAPLRLQSFLPPDYSVEEQSGFEWMNGSWLYEGIGFTWFGRLESVPDVTAGVELYFEELPRDNLAGILASLKLPVTPEMKTQDLVKVLGAIFQTHVFVDDRRTYIFRVGDPDVYEVSCTVHNEHRLIHVSLIRNDVRRRLAVA